MQLLNVAMGTVAGVLGLSFLLRTLHRLVIAGEAQEAEAARAQASGGERPAETAGSAAPEAPQTAAPQDAVAEHRPLVPADSPEPRGALDRVGPTSRRAKQVFRMWVVVFALVGAQMSWVLRPFIGDPTLPFTWFRAREGNFFLAVLRAIQDLLGL